MRYNQLGNSGLFVSEICLGAMTFGGQGQYRIIGEVPQSEATAMIERSLAAGVNFIDTADVYSQGHSERMVGQALRDLGVKRSEVVIATKGYNRTGPGANDIGASRGHIMDAVAASLDRLGLDHIDLYQIHSNDIVTPVEETMRALDDLVSQGLVRYVGVSNWQAWKVMKAQGIAERRGFARLATLQAYYSIASRDIEREIVPMLVDQKIGLMVWSPLAGGLLSGKYGPGAPGPEGARRAQFDSPRVDKERAWACIAALREIADQRDASVAAVALAYLLAKPFVTTIIVGARTMAQLDANLAATSITLTTEDMEMLDAVSALPAEYPGWFIDRQTPERIPPAFSGMGG